jgi:oligopeptide/dipeptide ABC transporter ATP-binding protein
MAERLARARDRLGTPLLAGAFASLSALLGLALLAPPLLGESAAAIRPADALQAASLAHLLGTDELGRDVLFRVLVASRLSLGISLAATLIGAGLGIVIGGLPGITGPRIGRLIAAAINLALAFPALLLALFVAAVVGAGAHSAVLAIALAVAPVFARLTYTLTASIRGADHIAAARLLGVSALRILVRHILPAVAGPLLVTIVIGISGALLVLSGLSFLGLGVQPPSYDWGVLLSQGLNRIYVSPVTSLAPAAAIVATGLMLAIIGEALAILTGARAPRRCSFSSEARSGAAGIVAPADRLLSVNALSIGFGRVDVVRGVSFALREGERIGIVGESGSGKTLTAMASAGLAIDSARVHAAGLSFLGRQLAPPASDAETRRLLGTRMAFVFQDPLGSFNPLLRIGGQLAEVAQEHLDMSHARALARAGDRLRIVGLDRPDERLDNYPHELSGGMLQRCMIGLGLMGEPELLIADEPTTALDVTVQKRVLDLIDDVCRSTGAGLLLISHDLAVVARSCRRVLVMYAGTIVEDVDVATLVAGAAHPYTRALRASVIEMDADPRQPLAMIAGTPPPPDAIPPGCAFAPRCTRAIAHCSEEAPDLVALGPGHRIACWNPCTMKEVA